MFTKRPTEIKLETEINAALTELENLEKTSEEYGTLVDRIAKLHKLKMEEHPKQINPDTVLVVAANLLGILWVTRYEREHVISTKALGFIMKPR
jgi:hypothetical protein